MALLLIFYSKRHSIHNNQKVSAYQAHESIHAAEKNAVLCCDSTFIINLRSIGYGHISPSISVVKYTISCGPAVFVGVCVCASPEI